MNICDLQPKNIIGYFSTLCSVPHGSGNTDKIADICVNFAKEHNLKYVRDDANNVVIFKPASKGYENKPTVIIQGHLDMVAVKTDDCDKDMAKDGLDLMTDGTWLWADKTSLGGDDCIAVATALAILDDDTLPHPALECVFTTDEETGMDGARALDTSILKGRTMINLDSEEEGVFTVGCAGGARVDTSVEFKRVSAPVGFGAFTVTVSGLKGGHSGAEIDKGRGSAITFLSRILADYKTENGIFLSLINGGTFDNVIPSFAKATVLINDGEGENFTNYCAEMQETFRKEYPDDCGVTVEAAPVTKAEDYENPISRGDTLGFLSALRALPQGVQKMSKENPGSVQTSMNTGVLRTTKEGKFTYSISVRSTKTSEKNELIGKIKAIAALLCADVDVHGEYPAWEYNPVSPLRDSLCRIFREITGKEPRLEIIHGGLECGFFGEKIEGLDTVALGPELVDIHSTNERLYLPSLPTMYKLVTKYLEEC